MNAGASAVVATPWVALAEGLSTSHVVGIVIGLIFGLGATTGLPEVLRQLRGVESYSPDPEPRRWPFGDQLWRGMIRAHFIAAFTMVPLFLVAGSVWLIVGIEGAGNDWRRVLSVVALIWLVAGVVSALSCILFNRPRFLVAASMRDDPGAVSVWLARDRDRGRRLAHLALPSALAMFVAGGLLWDTVSSHLGAVLSITAILLVLEVGRALDAEPPDAAPTGSTSDESS